MRPNFCTKIIIALCMSVTLVVGASGCGLLANALYAIKGNFRPAEYNALKGKKVAIVCGTDNGLASDPTSMLLTRYIQALLEQNIKDIEIIPHDKVSRWVQTHSSKDSDYEEIGKGVGAQQVLAVNLSNLTLRDGPTLYRGRCDISISVYDIEQNGRVVYRKQIPEFEFPKIGGTMATDTTEQKFQGLFLTIVSKKIATLFYAADPNEEHGLDAISNSF